MGEFADMALEEADWDTYYNEAFRKTVSLRGYLREQLSNIRKIIENNVESFLAELPEPHYETPYFAATFDYNQRGTWELGAGLFWYSEVGHLGFTVGPFSAFLKFKRFPGDSGL